MKKITAPHPQALTKSGSRADSSPAPSHPLQAAKRLTPRELAGPEGVADEASVREKYRALTRSLIRQGRTVTTMESCTAGLLASLITDTEGSSAVIQGAFVTYSNAAKVQTGVPEQVIEAYGVYSAETAAAMADACRDAFKADIGVGVTGSFGNPDPNNPDSIPGEVYFAIALDGGTETFHCSLPPQSSRFAYKIYMAEVIAGILLEKLSAPEQERNDLAVLPVQ